MYQRFKSTKIFEDKFLQFMIIWIIWIWNNRFTDGIYYEIQDLGWTKTERKFISFRYK